MLAYGLILEICCLEIILSCFPNNGEFWMPNKCTKIFHIVMGVCRYSSETIMKYNMPPWYDIWYLDLFQIQVGRFHWIFLMKINHLKIKLMQLTIQSHLLLSKSTQPTTGIPVAKFSQETNWLIDFFFFFLKAFQVSRSSSYDFIRASLVSDSYAIWFQTSNL